MLLKFKKLGDVLSLDDYNAIIYLLMRSEKLREEITLSPTWYDGDFGSYVFTYTDEITLKSDRYLVVDETSFLTISIASEFVGDFTITLRIYDDAFLDGVEGGEEEQSYSELKLYAENLGGRQEVVVPLNLIGAGKYISTTADVEVSYSKPIIDKNSGSIQLNVEQHLIKTTDDLYSAVENAPANQTTTIQLVPGSTYEMFSEDDESELNKPIQIDNKKIEIISGSLPSILDAKNLHRHFYITETGSLLLRNIDLINGCAYDEEEDNNKGGSIFVKSARDINNIKRQGELQAESCRFSNNIASQGGAIYNEDGFISISNTIFYNNESKSSSNQYGDGGAVYNEGAS